MAPLPRCYVASPLGFSEAGRHYYANVLLPALRTVVDPVDPWSLVPREEILAAVHDGRERDLALEIGKRNRTALEECELVVAVLEGQEIDSGTAAEVGFAAARGVPCLGLRSDLRHSGEAGVRVNLQLESFILMSGGAILGSLEELLLAVRERNAATTAVRSC